MEVCSDAITKRLLLFERGCEWRELNATGFSSSGSVVTFYKPRVDGYKAKEF